MRGSPRTAELPSLVLAMTLGCGSPASTATDGGRDGPAGNRAPRIESLADPALVVEQDSRAYNERNALRLQATDPDGDPLQWAIATGAEHGTATLEPTDGTTTTLRYEPDRFWVGRDELTVRVRDDRGASSSAVAVVRTEHLYPRCLLPDGDPPAPDPGLELSVTYEGGELTVQDTTGSSPVDIIAPNDRPVAAAPDGADGLEVSTELTRTEQGFDITVRYRNTADEPREMGSIVVPGIRFGQVVTAFDFRHSSRPVTLDHGGDFFFGPTFTYPRSLYSPVGVLVGESYTVGASLLYPVLEHGEPVSVGPRSPGGIHTRGGRNWELTFRHARTRGGGRGFEPTEIPAGAEREYVLAVRIVRNDRAWIRTLMPYREHFRARFGGARYRRDGRPVSHQIVAGRWVFPDPPPDGFDAETSDNPYGFFERVDEDGWGGWADWTRESLDAKGYERFMLWKPTGVFGPNNPKPNYPFQFMTEMRNVPAMRDSLDALASLSDDVAPGYWWGRSTQVMYEWFDDDRVEPLDPDDPEHVSQAFDELDMAASIDAGAVGLDAFVYTPASERYRWLQRMRDRAPAIKFVTEPSQPDFMHTLGPTFIFKHADSTTPHALADFLLPFHETWGYLRFDLIDGTDTDEQKLQWIRDAADAGMTPVPTTSPELPSPSDYRARRGWEHTIPEDLRPVCTLPE